MPDITGDASISADKLIRDIGDINFVEIIFIIVAISALIWLIKRYLPIIAEHAPNKMRLYLLAAVPISRLVLLVAGTFWVIPLVFDITLKNFFVIAGTVSVALGFAFKDYASSLLAGVVVVFERPYQLGDWVKIDEHYGEVIEMGSRVVRILTPADDVITVPHDKIWDSNIANSNNGANTLMCVTHFYVASDHDAQKVRNALRRVALTSIYLQYQKPVMVVLSQTPYGTHYKVKAYPYDMRDQFMLISDLTIRGKKAIADIGAREIDSTVAGELSQ